jgi:hypothetical protein
MFDNLYQQAIYRHGLELEEDWERKQGAAMKVIYEDWEAKLTVGEGAVILNIAAWGHTSSISTSIWEKLVQAWLRMRHTTPAGEVWVISKDRLKLFLAEAKRASFLHEVTGDCQVVKLRKVKELLYNLASGRAPDEAQPPSWAGKDCVGALLQRGWKITDDGEGLQRRGFFISGNLLRDTVYEGGVESTADMLELEHAERTDREDKR